MDDEKYNGQTVPLAYHEMCVTRHHRLIARLIIGWAVSVVLAVVACVATFAYMWLQYDYTGVITETTTTEYSGVYNITDSEGNIISSDLTPDDVIHIMEALNGDSKKNEYQNQYTNP